ncbi:hypothetical protein ACFQI7_36750 [Paenibacillus allorhizosphaerae]|uniref:DUF1266 domain-containing protein n=1 Tax=Paenibacillus allorhizosphaerae TaxID=2849866 RepID=A0ABM8VUI5_9BACL|nr:hypothetical protein [Paenibacillus allorhizosphaerae]CAG7658988.1 hypothetical protein PAECIP111802_07244 [Paenibacillus allorhizosphaerae]
MFNESVRQEWFHAYAMLALRINRLVSESSGGTILIFHGPDAWRRAAEEEQLVSAEQLASEAERIMQEIPFEHRRATYLTGQLRAMSSVARRLAGETLPLSKYADQCLGFTPEWLSETLFKEAHAELDEALPKSGGTLASRLQGWQASYVLNQKKQLFNVIERAVTEVRRRTNAILPLPENETIDCQRTDNPYMLAGGLYRGELRSTLFVNDSLPFILADLLYVVAHECYPGHIAESVLKDVHLVRKKGFMEQQVQFMLSPQFVIMEGLGLLAEELIFPGDEAQTWLTENIFKPLNIPEVGGNIAVVHHAKNVLWGVWANAALMADEGGTDEEVRDYLAQWALLHGQELESALAIAKGGPYIFCYYYGWKMLRDWIQLPQRNDEQMRRIFTEQLLPEDII